MKQYLIRWKYIKGGAEKVTHAEGNTADEALTTFHRQQNYYQFEEQIRVIVSVKEYIPAP